MGDLNTFLKRIVALRQSIADDGNTNGVPFTENDIHYLTERLSSEGSSFVKVTCPLLGKALDRALICGQFDCPTNFALRKGTRLPRFCYLAFSQILDDSGVLRPSPNITTIFFLRQFLLLDGKLITEPTREQEELAISGFINRQARLGKVKLPINHPVLLRAKRLLGRCLKRLDLRDIVPGHGPGGVAEGYDRFERWDIRAWPSRAERWYPFHEYGSQSFVALCSQGAPVMVKDSITKCSLVPKDFKGPRLISSESTATQYLQQGQMKLIMRYVDTHWLMSKSIKFKDQTFNQSKCSTAYEDGVATLDLSNASDTVSAALVWYLLSEVPTLRSQLFATRSQYMSVRGSLVRLTAFSPMGSAVCFPVETLVFWSLTMASVRHVQSSWSDGLKDPTLPSESEMASAIAVFGDDILVPDYALAVLIGTLSEVGCEVNESKTCFQTPFRESCGAEYFNNTDVAIIRNRRYYYDDRKEFISIPVLLDLQRKFFLCGLYNTAALLRRWAEEVQPIITQRPEGVSILLDCGSVILSLNRHGQKFVLVGDRLGYRFRVRVDSSYYQVLRNSSTAVPSEFGRVLRDSGSFDKICCAFGFDASLGRGVRTRYNKDYQRWECRLPCFFQQTREWPLQMHSGHTGSEFGPCARRNRFIPSQVRRIRLDTGYPRLLSRVVGDTVERIAIRTVMVKMAWTELPSNLVSQLVRG